MRRVDQSKDRWEIASLVHLTLTFFSSVIKSLDDETHNSNSNTRTSELKKRQLNMSTNEKKEDIFPWMTPKKLNNVLEWQQMTHICLLFSRSNVISSLNLFILVSNEIKQKYTWKESPRYSQRDKTTHKILSRSSKFISVILWYFSRSPYLITDTHV